MAPTDQSKSLNPRTGRQSQSKQSKKAQEEPKVKRPRGRPRKHDVKPVNIDKKRRKGAKSISNWIAKQLIQGEKLSFGQVARKLTAELYRRNRERQATGLTKQQQRHLFHTMQQHAKQKAAQSVESQNVDQTNASGLLHD